MTIEQGDTQRGQGLPTITERVSTRAIEALMANYRDPQQAFLELIDNAVDNRIEGNSLIARIRVSKNELSVFNQGGRGLDFEGLENFFTWGYSEKTAKEIGFYGVGGKAAMGYLGRSMEVICSPKGSQVEYHVFDPSWETREEGEWKQFTPEERKAFTQDGYFRVRIANLKREVNAPALITRLSDIYRPLLLDGSVEISINNKRVSPLEIRYKEDDLTLVPQQIKVQTRMGDWVVMKLGVLEEGQRIKPGIRSYYNGRLIDDGEFFGQPTPAQMPQMSRFIGEAHLDFVPVTTNKNSFNRGSVQYDAAARRINLALAPWVEKMAKMRIEERMPIESFEKELARRAKRVLEHVFATTGLITKGMLLEGESAGRRPGSPTGLPPKPRGEGGGPGPKEGQTAPVLGATIGEIKRWGAMFDWQVTSMGSGAKRSDSVYENGKQVLKINTDYSLYQAAKKAGDPALEMYIAESAIMKISEIVTRGRSVDEYLELVDNLTRDCGAVYQTRIREQRTTRNHSQSAR